MNIRLPHPPIIDLQSNRFEEPLKVDMQAFLDFSFWMSEELLDLEAKFASKTSVAETSKVMH
jgi:hypothetical protein